MNTIKIEQPKLSYNMKEELNTLRTSIQFAGMDKKVIMLTSCLASEGKSTISLNLAISLAVQGNRVVYIDADLRRSALMKRITEGSANKGLSHYLSGQSTITDVVCATDIPRLRIIVAGPVPPNPTELLSRPLFKSTVEQLKEACDYIIIDVPPLGMVVDAAIVAGVCDASILLIESGNIRYHFAQEVKNKLIATGCPFLGVVLNKVNYAKDGYYGRYYGKRYGKYGKYAKYGKYGEYGGYGNKPVDEK